MEPPAESAESEAPGEAAGEDDASQDAPPREIPDRTRYAGSFYSPELNTTYRMLEDGGTGLTLHAGRLDPATLLAGSDGVLTSERGLTFRFSALAGRPLSGADGGRGAGAEPAVHAGRGVATGT